MPNIESLIFWISVGAAALNTGMIVVNLREYKRYCHQLGELHMRELELRYRESLFNTRVNEAQSALMPDMREYLDEVSQETFHKEQA